MMKRPKSRNVGLPKVPAGKGQPRMRPRLLTHVTLSLHITLASPLPSPPSNITASLQWWPVVFSAVSDHKQGWRGGVWRDGGGGASGWSVQPPLGMPDNPV